MKGYNRIAILGNLVRDPEVRLSSSGKTCAKFTVAVNRAWRGPDGEKKEHVDYLPCVAWGPLADAIGQWLHKGSAVFVDGSVQTRSYEKDGARRYVTEVNVREVNFLPGGSSKNGQSGPSGPSREPGDSGEIDISEHASEYAEEGPEVDIPF
jgi:single-strand DNA-binding protein